MLLGMFVRGEGEGEGVDASYSLGDVDVVG